VVEAVAVDTEAVAVEGEDIEEVEEDMVAAVEEVDMAVDDVTIAEAAVADIEEDAIVMVTTEGEETGEGEGLVSEEKFDILYFLLTKAAG